VSLAEVTQENQMRDEECKCASRSTETVDLDNWSACMRELSLHILDILQNSLEARATRVELTIEEDRTADRLTVTVRDDGRGMDESQLACIFDPFYTTRSTRHVGLGLPLFKAAAERCNGKLTITSQPGQGTTVQAMFQYSHIDRAPMGDMTGTLMSFILAGTCDLHYLHQADGKVFEFDTAAIKVELDDVPLTHPDVRIWLQEFIAAGEANLA